VRVGLSHGIPISLFGFNVFRCDRSRAAGGCVALFVNRLIMADFSFCFNDVSILVGSIYNPDWLHFDQVKTFLDSMLALI
jgi:hypothetical protein